MSAVNKNTALPESPNVRRASRIRGRTSMSNVVIGILFLVTFICGSIAGGLFASNKFAQQLRERTLNTEHHGSTVLQQMERELELTTQQIELVRPLVEEHFVLIAEIRQQAIPQVVTEQRRLEAQVSTHLNDSQKSKWKQRCQWVRKHCYPTAEQTKNE